MFNHAVIAMDEVKRLDLLFFELASEDRLAILRLLCDSKLKMQDIARKLDLTATEALRQLQRLSQAKLIERESDGLYSTSALGRLLLRLSASMELAYRQGDYFLAHDVNRIPSSFVNRLGELSQATLVDNLNEDLGRWEALIMDANEHVWVMTPQVMGHLSHAMAGKLLKGVKLRSIMSEKIRETKVDLPSGKDVERKLLADVPLIIMISEKEASVSFPKLDGPVDFPSFFGSEATFLGLASDLYLHYWEQAKFWYPSI